MMEASGPASLRRLIELLTAGVLIVIASPLMAFLAILVKLDSHGPVLYRDRRIGMDGKSFQMFKFRTMTHDRDDSGLSVTFDKDPRITAFGRLIRPARLDELPQLINVLAGEMSFVGPRPESPAIVALYSPAQRRVLRLRPGITGLAQLVFLHEADNISAEDPLDEYVTKVLPRKLSLDLYYLEHRSPLLDAEICLKTLLVPFEAIRASWQGRSRVIRETT